MSLSSVLFLSIDITSSSQSSGFLRYILTAAVSTASYTLMFSSSTKYSSMSSTESIFSAYSPRIHMIAPLESTSSYHLSCSHSVDTSLSNCSGYFLKMSFATTMASYRAESAPSCLAISSMMSTARLAQRSTLMATCPMVLTDFLANSSSM